MKAEPSRLIFRKLTEILKLLKHCEDPRAPLFCVTLHQHNSLADRARELFKLWEDAESLLVRI